MRRLTQLDASPRVLYLVPRVKSSDALAKPRVIVVVTTVGTEEQALDIAHHLVRNGLVACVNILPAVRSVFRWKGKVTVDGEFMLLVKTVESNFEAVRSAMKELNAYELPEILGFPATFADAAFASWVAESSAGQAAVEEEEESFAP